MSMGLFLNETPQKPSRFSQIPTEQLQIASQFDLLQAPGLPADAGQSQKPDFMKPNAMGNGNLTSSNLSNMHGISSQNLDAGLTEAQAQNLKA